MDGPTLRTCGAGNGGGDGARTVRADMDVCLQELPIRAADLVNLPSDGLFLKQKNCVTAKYTRSSKFCKKLLVQVTCQTDLTKGIRQVYR